jgi:hypothetical protein
MNELIIKKPRITEKSGIQAEALGVYTFAIRATNVTCSTDSTLKTLTINPPGNRRDATNFQTDMILTKRYTGTQWVNVTTFKRYNGTAWVDIVN